MPRLSTLVSMLTAAILCGSLFATNTQPTIQSLNKMPLSFTKNMGQWDERVLFRANAGGATMWFTKEGVTYQFTRRIANPVGAALAAARDSGQNAMTAGDREGRPYNPGERFSDERDSVEQLVLTAKFLGANPNPEIIAEGQMEYKCNYFLGNDPAKWHTDVPNYEAITLKDIYPGIDLKYSGDGTGQAAYEFIVAPGADIAQIKIAYEGAEATSLDSDGRLILKTKWGDMTAAMKSPADSPRPVGEGSGVRAGLSGTACFSQLSEHTLGLAANGQSLAQANSGTLALSYSTYLGGTSADQGYDIAVDGSGNAYVTGYTYSTDFPTLNPYDPGYDVNGYSDAFVTKLSSSGNSLIYSTYLGGESGDYGNGIAVDGSGNAYVTGETWSTDFPTLNPYQTFQGGEDAFVTKLSYTGNSLIYSTYLGGSGYENNWPVGAIAVDGSGCAYVTGSTTSSNFPTLNPFQSTKQGGCDVFVTKLSIDGASLIYSTYLGGNGAENDYGRGGIAVDGSGNAYVTGTTSSSNFPTMNPYQATFQGMVDVFVTKFSIDGASLIYSTYLGGRGAERGLGIAVDRSGNAYVTGSTTSDNFPTFNPYQATFQGMVDVFVTKLSSTGASLIYSTYLGGSSYEDADAYGSIGSIAVDGSGNAYVTGTTGSTNFPSMNAYQATFQGGNSYQPKDAFVTKFSVSGAHLVYSTYLGGGSDDQGYGIAVDGGGNAYVTGTTDSPDFPTVNPYQATGGGDAFVTKLTWTPGYRRGDVNSDGLITLLDLVLLGKYVSFGDPVPQPLSLADVDCSGGIDMSDLVLLVNYYFRSGPAPCTGGK